ncbi:ArfGap-domain-containing protein [Nadsonia fulvescens var. elongata DSM 6958]|uniref:ADP-ribosylation factor GTPase-activating protein n=1 Tax=Nadsonia fulvescens var. elongata DSM 6958 TaxID=857566 RepID=A0A1E3PF37_9ASCO|nr:ArfGap-domain-containing protein [Nadsonia fulvescens var. elongata DSM 6958]
MGQSQSSLNDPTSSLYIPQPSRFAITQCQIYHNSHIPTTVLSPGKSLQLANDDGTSTPLLDIVPTGDKGPIQVTGGSGYTPEFVLDNEAKGGYFPFLLKLPVSSLSGVVLRFTLRVQTPVSNLTFIASSSKAELEDFITREFHHRRDEIHDNENVILLGDFINSQNNSNILEFDFIWRPPAADPQFGQPRQERYTCAFTEYNKREDRLNMISLFSLWIPSLPLRQLLFDDDDDDEEEEHAVNSAEDSDEDNLDDLDIVEPITTAATTTSTATTTTTTTGSPHNYSFPLKRGYQYVRDEPHMLLSSPMFDPQPVTPVMNNNLEDNIISTTGSVAGFNINSKETPEAPATSGLPGAGVNAPTLTSALKSSPTRSIKPTNNNSTTPNNSHGLTPSRSMLANTLSITRPSDNNVSQPVDGPLFRAAISALEKDTGLLKQKIKKLLKSATNLLQQQSFFLESRAHFTFALNDLNIRPLGYTFRNYDTRLVQMHQASIDHLRTYVIEPLKRLYEVDIKSFEIKKREFDDESRDYYSYLARYLTIKNDATAKDKQKADTKHNEKRRSFELRRFDYYSYINDLNGGRKLQHILYCIGLFIEAEVGQFLTTATAYETEIKPKLDHIIAQIKDAYKDWTRQRTDREVRRRQLERSLLGIDTQQKTPYAPGPSSGHRYMPSVQVESTLGSTTESDIPSIPLTTPSSTTPPNNPLLPAMVNTPSATIDATTSGPVSSTVSATMASAATTRPIQISLPSTDSSILSTNKPTLKVHTSFETANVFNSMEPAIQNSMTEERDTAEGDCNTGAKQVTKSMIIDEGAEQNSTQSSVESIKESLEKPLNLILNPSLFALAEESPILDPNSNRRKEGLLWSMSRSKAKAKANDPPINLNKASGWHKYWVVVAGGKLSEYTNWKQGLEPHNDPINLRVALVREPTKQFERRFCFEIITPNLKRVYQATSEEDMVEWIRVINNAIVSTIDGSSSSVKGFKLDYELPSSHSSNNLEIANSDSNTNDVATNYLTTGLSRSATSKHYSANTNSNTSNSSHSRNRSKSITSSGLLQSNRAVGSSFGPSNTTSANVTPFPSSNSKMGSMMKPETAFSDGLLAVVQAHSASNLICADCGSKSNVEWISMNLLCVLCISCSGVHRSLGSHISKIRSLTLDTQAFTPSIADLLAGSVNNATFNMIWEPDTALNNNQTGLKKRLHDLNSMQSIGATNITNISGGVAVSDLTQARISYIQEKYVIKSFVKPVEKPNAALRISIRRGDVNGILHALASRANLNTIAALDVEGLRSKRDKLLSSLIQGSLIVYSLLCSTEDDEINLTSRMTFPIAELLLLNGSKLPLPSDEAFRELNDDLSVNAQRWIMTRMQREFGDTVMAPIPKVNSGYSSNKTISASPNTIPGSSNGYRAASPMANYNPGEAIFNSLASDKKHISASVVGAKLQKRLSSSLAK